MKLRVQAASLLLLFVAGAAQGAEVQTSGFYGEDVFGAPGDELRVSHGSDPGLRITRLEWDLGGSPFDLVFDPEQPSGGQPGELRDTVGDSGFSGDLIWSEGFFQTEPEARMVYRKLTIEFADFDSCEEIVVLADVDGEGGMGAFVSPAEFAGTTLTVTYSDGSSTRVETGTHQVAGSLAEAAISESAPEFDAIPPLLLQVNRDQLTWCAKSAVERFDVVRGALEQLDATAGDFAVATEECLVDDYIPSALTYAIDPGIGQGFWFLVRDATGPGSGSYDSGGQGQAESRDMEIALSPFACP
ncbi:hypothetical protein ABI59_09185 [Acidobacteria bacterium Mor1]|nr:hypothetical protein ABI59_09185 [Acidobacteria bacterium Mor1]